MQIQKKTCRNRASQQKIGPSYFDRALANLTLMVLVISTFSVSKIRVNPPEVLFLGCLLLMAFTQLAFAKNKI